MPLWIVSTERGALPNWSDVRLVVSFREFGGHDWALIEADAPHADAVRQQRGVEAVTPARDGLYLDSSGGYYEVTQEGTQVARCHLKNGFVAAA